MTSDNDHGGTSLTAGAAVSVSASDQLSHAAPTGKHPRWVVDDDAQHLCIRPARTGFLIAFVPKSNIDCADHIGTPVDHAHLIAAAPEMYEALTSLANEATGFLAMADPSAHGQTNLRCLQRRIDEACAAIAKAEGRQP
jgi:hypothetical protein